MSKLPARAWLLLLLAAVSCGRADAAPAAVDGDAELRQLPAGSTADMIAAAEAEGAAFPRDSILRRDSVMQPRPFDPAVRVPVQIIGTRERRCVEVPTTFEGPPNLATQVRSGEFIAGGYLTQLIHGRPIKLWWAPVNSSLDMVLLVRGRRIGAPKDTLRSEISDVRVPLNSQTHEPYANEAAFATGVDFPSPGTWLLVTTSERNWGCFLVTIRPGASPSDSAAARASGS